MKVNCPACNGTQRVWETAVPEDGGLAAHALGCACQECRAIRRHERFLTGDIIACPRCAGTGIVEG